MAVTITADNFEELVLKERQARTASISGLCGAVPADGGTNH